MFQVVRYGTALLSSLVVFGCTQPVDPAKQAEAERLRAEVEELSSSYSDLLKEKQLLTTQNRDNEALIRNLDHNYKNELETRAKAKEIRDYVNALESADSQVRESLDTWRQATRDSFVGRKIPDLTLLSGTRYSDVIVTEVSDESFVVEASGSTRVKIPFSDVSEQVRTALVYEPSILTGDSASLSAP